MPSADDPKPPKHYTREPWRVVVIAAIATGLMPLWKYWEVQEGNTTKLSLPVLILGFASAGAIAAILLIARSHIRSVYWSNVVLCSGMVVVALLVAWASEVVGFRYHR